MRWGCRSPLFLILSACLLSCAGSGCHGLDCCQRAVAFRPEMPRELDKVNLPYVIEPPDILLIDVVRAVPKPPYRIEPLDLLLIQVADVLPDEPIGAIFTVEPQGTINLGPSYGTVRLVGLTLDEAKAAIQKHLAGLGFNKARVMVALQQTRSLQAVAGEHLVRPDGAVGLGVYGSVYVTGMTLEHAKMAIEAHLAQYLVDPKISLDVFSYNSKVYYVIIDGGGYGQQVYRLPFTGNETVLDAISQINGLPPVASTKRLRLARPAPLDASSCEVMDIDWKSITMCASSATNYQLMAGDRIYVSADCWIAFDNAVAKFVSPFERLLGFTLLGNTTVRALDGQEIGTGSSR
jgi:polysaccharide biosynthesis/export protein